MPALAAPAQSEANDPVKFLLHIQTYAIVPRPFCTTYLL